MPNFNKEEKIISFSLFLGGVISNSIGVIVSLIYAHLNRFNLFNFISTSSSLLIIITLFTILWKKQLYLLYAKVIVVITAFIFFPTILLTSPDAIFFPYIGLLGSSFGFLNFKNYKLGNRAAKKCNRYGMDKYKNTCINTLDNNIPNKNNFQNKYKNKLCPKQHTAYFRWVECFLFIFIVYYFKNFIQLFPSS